MSLFSSIHSNHEEPWPRAAGTAGAAAGASAVQPYKLQPEVGFLRPRIAEGEGFSARGGGSAPPARFPVCNCGGCRVVTVDSVLQVRDTCALVLRESSSL